MSLVSSIVALATRVSAEIKLQRDTNRSVTYILAGELQGFPANPTEAQKRAVIDNNNAAVKAALTARPFSTITLDPKQPWPLALDLNEFLAGGAFVKTKPISIKGPVMLVRGTQAFNGDSHTNVIAGNPVVSITRAGGAPISVVSIDNSLQVGPSGSPAGYFTQFASGFKFATGTYSQFRQGQLYHLSSNDYYLWAMRAVNANVVWKAAFVPIAGLLLSVGAYSLAAANTAMGTSGKTVFNSMEQRTVVGVDSGATALIQGDAQGQMVANSISKDFIGGETLKDQESGAIIGAFASHTVLMAGKLNTTYPTNPVMRLVPRVPVTLDLDIYCDGDPDDFVLEYNRTDAINLAGVTDYDIKARIYAGYAAGIVLRSCWKGKVDAEIVGLPNHAQEVSNADGSKDQTRTQGAYGYGVRFLGCTEDFDVRVHITFGRHAVTTNGSGATYNGTSTGTNYWNYGPGARHGRITGIARNMFGTGWDMHEGAEDLVFDTPLVFNPSSAARTVTGPDGLTIRGFNITVINPYFEGVRTGIADGGVALLTDLVFENRILGGVIKNFQSTGFSASDMPASNSGRILVDGTTFRADPALTDYNKQQSVGLILRSGNIQTRNIRVEGCNYAMIIQKPSATMDAGNGVVPTAPSRLLHVSPVFDWTDAVANSCVRQEAVSVDHTMIDPTLVVNPTIGGSTIVKPTHVVRNFSGNTPFRYKDIVFVYLSSNTTAPGLIEMNSGTTPATTNLGGSGAAGAPGASAYDLAVAGGYSGTQAQWLASLKGADGAASTVPGPASTVPGPAGPAGPGAIGSGLPSGMDLTASYIRVAANTAMPLPAGGGTFTAIPHSVRVPTSIQGLVVQVGTAGVPGAATIGAKMGLWADKDGFPDVAAGPLFTASVDLTSAAAKRVLPWSTVLQPGVYWFGFLYTATAAPTTAPSLYLITGSSWNLPIPAASSFANATYGLKWASVTDYPATLSGVTFAGAGEAPAMGLRGA